MKNREQLKTYHCFHRTWWKESDSSWPNRLEPQLGEKHTLAEGVSYDDALAICKAWNRSHEPGRLNDKAEFEQE